MPTKVPTAVPRRLSLRQASLYLGISDTKVRQLVKLRMMPQPFRDRGRLYFRFEDLRAWRNAGCPI